MFAFSQGASLLTCYGRENWIHLQQNISLGSVGVLDEFCLDVQVRGVTGGSFRESPWKLGVIIKFPVAGKVDCMIRACLFSCTHHLFSAQDDRDVDWEKDCEAQG